MSSSIKAMGMQMARSATTAALPTLSKKFSSLLKTELTSPDFSTKYNQQQQEDFWNAMTNVCEVKKSEKFSARFTRVMKKGLSGFQGGRRTRKKGSPSKTHKGRKDFTTKKGDKVFHRKKHYVRKSRKPFMGLF